MKAKDNLGRELDLLFVVKTQRRWQLAALPFPEKARIIADLQRMVETIRKVRGLPTIVWDIDDGLRAIHTGR
jgi:hypothetical protein